MANMLILRLDGAEETRLLSVEEHWLRNTLRASVLGLSCLERTITCQRSRVRWLKEVDANTRLFHAVTNGRRVKNFVLALKHDDAIITDQAQKEDIFFEVYN
jgi:hypothetical protein